MRGTRKLVIKHYTIPFHIQRFRYIVWLGQSSAPLQLYIPCVHIKSLQYEEQGSWLHNMEGLVIILLFSFHIKRFRSIGRLIGNFTVKILGISFWNSVTWKRYKRKCFSEQYRTILAMFRSDVDLVRLDDSCSAMCTLLIRYYYIP